MRCVRILCVVLLVFTTGNLCAQNLAKHHDPPGPPEVVEKMSLYELTLTTDQDDGWWFDTDTEIMVRTTVNMPNHPEATTTWVMQFNDIDMDGERATDYTVLDGEEEDDERKGGEVQIFSHFECSPTVAPSVTIHVWEVDSVSVSDVLEKLGEAAGALTSAGVLNGSLFDGETAAKLGQAVEDLCKDELDLGVRTVLNVGTGVSELVSPTVDYKFRTNYTIEVSNPQACADENSRVTAWELLNILTLSEEDRAMLRLRGMGWDEFHPFTMSPQEAERRGIHLRDALQLVDGIGVEPGVVYPEIEDRKEELRVSISTIGCDILETEVDEAFLGEIVPTLVYDAQDALEDGRALVDAGDYSGALDACLALIPEMLTLNHPKFFWDGFEKGTTLTWSFTQYGGIVVID